MSAWRDQWPTGATQPPVCSSSGSMNVGSATRWLALGAGGWPLRVSESNSAIALDSAVGGVVRCAGGVVCVAGGPTGGGAVWYCGAAGGGAVAYEGAACGGAACVGAIVGGGAVRSCGGWVSSAGLGAAGAG